MAIGLGRPTVPREIHGGLAGSQRLVQDGDSQAVGSPKGEATSAVCLTQRFPSESRIWVMVEREDRQGQGILEWMVLYLSVCSAAVIQRLGKLAVLFRFMDLQSLATTCILVWLAISRGLLLCRST